MQQNTNYINVWSRRPNLFLSQRISSIYYHIARLFEIFSHFITICMFSGMPLEYAHTEASELYVILPLYNIDYCVLPTCPNSYNTTMI